jgi:RNA polymerase sigma-70 factor (ECF subfamily)
MLLSCHHSLYRYARALSHDPSVAEELVQETFERALAAKRRPEPLTTGNVRPWAFTILRHIWQNSLRCAAREVQAELEEGELPDASAEPMEMVLTRQLLRSEIVQAIDSLPDGFREVIVLREIEGMSYAEISAVLRCPPGTVMSRLARGREMLRRMLIRFAPSNQEMAR